MYNHNPLHVVIQKTLDKEPRHKARDNHTENNPSCVTVLPYPKRENTK